MKKKLKGICYPREKVRKLCLMTKLSLILTFFCLQIQANGFSQQTRLSIKMDNVSMKQLFAEIEKRTDLAFVYNTQDVDQLGTVNVNFTDEEIGNILDYCLRGKGINYSIVNNHVVIRKGEQQLPQQKARKITGKVLDKANHEPLPGATVKIKGTNIGTATDITGAFQLSVLEDNTELEVSFIGYAPQKITLGKSNEVTVYLEPQTSEMEEVVVTGMFTRKADSYTGAVTTIKKEELQRVGNQNILQSLKNIDPSFQVLENNDFGSDPNRVPEIQMRGASSFTDMKDKYQTNPNQPLFIVDGFEQTIEKVMDMDMNRVVGTHDILMLCFDTLRYDVSKAEEAAGGTPVLNSHGGLWEKRHAPGNFTYPSHFAIFAGFLPSPAEPHSLRSRKWLFFPVQAGTGRIPPKGSYPFTEATFVQSLANKGYETICIGGVNFFSKRNELGRVFPGYFTKSYWLPIFGCTAPDSTEKQIDFALKKLENYSADKRIFMYINFSAIHYPNCHYVKGKTKDDKESHAAALRYIDSQLPRLFEVFQKRADTLVIALSDHGTCYGEDGYEYHCISHETVYTVPYKHFILTKQ